MELLAIDVGSYSVKFLDCEVDNKGVQILSYQEVLVDLIRDQMSVDSTLEEIQIEILKSYLYQNPFDGKIVYQLANNHLTFRLLELPVAQKKKAEMMIPFQLDEELPYSIHDAHYISTLFKQEKGYQALVNIAKTETFEGIYNNLQSKEILPAVLTSELSIIQSYIEQQNISGAYCILDIGHSSSKAYFVHNKTLVSTHTSHVAGESINEIISGHYSLPRDQAIIYKHQNSFFLTEAQYDKVTPDQKEFAILMKKTLWPLILDIKRWDLGYRVNQGYSVDKIYIIGGTSLITNAENFLTQSTGIKTEKLQFLQDIKITSEDVSEKKLQNFHIAKMMANAQKSKIIPINFLTGQFLSSYNQFIPMHSFAFVFTRVMAFCLLVVLTLSIERISFLNTNLKTVDRKLSKLLKNPDLQITRNDRKTYKKAPEKTLKTIIKKNKMVTQEIKSMMSATTVNGVSPLEKLSQTIPSSKNLDLISYKSEGKKATAVFTSKSAKELNNLKEIIEKSNLDAFDIKIDQKENKLSFKFEDQ